MLCGLSGATHISYIYVSFLPKFSLKTTCLRYPIKYYLLARQQSLPVISLPPTFLKFTLQAFSRNLFLSNFSKVYIFTLPKVFSQRSLTLSHNKVFCSPNCLSFPKFFTLVSKILLLR